MKRDSKLVPFASTRNRVASTELQPDQVRNSRIPTLRVNCPILHFCTDICLSPRLFRPLPPQNAISRFPVSHSATFQPPHIPARHPLISVSFTGLSRYQHHKSIFSPTSPGRGTTFSRTSPFFAPHFWRTFWLAVLCETVFATSRLIFFLSTTHQSRRPERKGEDSKKGLTLQPPIHIQKQSKPLTRIPHPPVLPLHTITRLHALGT